VSERLNKARRIVVKIGSALLVDGDMGTLKAAWLASLSEDLARAREKGETSDNVKIENWKP
jgi:glutamate 5-kinase